MPNVPNCKREPTKTASRSSRQNVALRCQCADRSLVPPADASAAVRFLGMTGVRNRRSSAALVLARSLRGTANSSSNPRRRGRPRSTTTTGAFPRDKATLKTLGVSAAEQIWQARRCPGCPQDEDDEGTEWLAQEKRRLQRERPNSPRPTEPVGRHRSASSISPMTSWHRKHAIDACWIAKPSEQLSRRQPR